MVIVTASAAIAQVAVVVGALLAAMYVGRCELDEACVLHFCASAASHPQVHVTHSVHMHAPAMRRFHLCALQGA